MSVTVSDIPFGTNSSVSISVKERIFRERGENRYSLELLPVRITLEVDRLRRSSQELWGEVAVTVDPTVLRQAKFIDHGILSIGDLNFSSPNARTTRAKYIRQRSGAEHLDWDGFMEEFCTKVIDHQRKGATDIGLREVMRPQADRMFHAGSVELPLKHPMVLFGDGGTAKSYLALWWAGQLTQAGIEVLYADWEFTAEEHRERLEYLFGPDFPNVRYLACHRSFPHEAERISRVIRARKIAYLMVDSIGFACGGDPNSSEAATMYFQALRGLGEIGSLHIAHVTKGLKDGGDLKPFGSAFWHNMARVTLNIKGEELNNGDLAVALYPRKRNLKGKGSPSAYTIHFGPSQTVITPSDVRSHAELSESLPIAERLMDALKMGSKTRKELAELLDVEYGILQRTVHRELKKHTIAEIEGVKRGSTRIALSTGADEF